MPMCRFILPGTLGSTTLSISSLTLGGSPHKIDAGGEFFDPHVHSCCWQSWSSTSSWYYWSQWITWSWSNLWIVVCDDHHLLPCVKTQHLIKVGTQVRQHYGSAVGHGGLPPQPRPRLPHPPQDRDGEDSHQFTFFLPPQSISSGFSSFQVPPYILVLLSIGATRVTLSSSRLKIILIILITIVIQIPVRHGKLWFSCW